MVSQPKASFLVKYSILGVYTVVFALCLLVPKPHVCGNPYREFNEWTFGFMLPSFVRKWGEMTFGEDMRFYVLLYLRDLMVGYFVYFLEAGIWSYFIYVKYGNELFPEEKKKPKRELMFGQIRLASKSMLLYAALPVLSEFLIENGYTKVYFSLDDIGGPGSYFMWLGVYFAFVEMGIYWAHRKLHTVKFFYNYLHGKHHMFKKQDEMTPWCSVSFNPIDGMMQASPYVISYFFIPCHYLTHLFFLFATCLWATYIHDGLEACTEPLMGSKYHTVHHTHYMYNFGQVFTFCDWIFGTLRDPHLKGVSYGRSTKLTTSLPKEKPQ